MRRSALKKDNDFDCDGLYIIESGSVNIMIGNEINHSLFRSDSFGESKILKIPVIINIILINHIEF